MWIKALQQMIMALLFSIYYETYCFEYGWTQTKFGDLEGVTLTSEVFRKDVLLFNNIQILIYIYIRALSLFNVGWWWCNDQNWHLVFSKLISNFVDIIIKTGAVSQRKCLGQGTKIVYGAL